MVGAVLASTTAFALSAPRASADVNSDKATIAQLGEQIAQQGARVQQLVVSYDQAQARQATLVAELQVAHGRLLDDRRAQAQANSVLRQLALQSYMDGAGDNSALTLFQTGSIATLAAAQQYSDIATGRLHSAIDAVELDATETQQAATKLQSAEAQAAANVQQLDAAQQDAQAALNHDDTLLSQTKGNLQVLLAQQAAEEKAEEQEEEEAMAARAAAAAAAKAAAQASEQTDAPSTTSQPVTVTFDPTPGSYADPLRSINALTPERVDQGVDYSGYGPIYAIGDGVVASTVNSGWPGGTFICYRLSDGPAAGLAVYAAEDIDPQISAGQSVTAGTVLGTMYEGPDGIETGWADPSCDGVSMANDAGQFSGANSTAFGANFSQLLASVGAPPGVMQNDPATGVLPSGWPGW